MAQEIKNTFLKSKMNKDLDDRILPNGEYRDARNISVGRSEDNDVGALENIIGNNLVTGTDIGNGLTIIGVLADSSTDSIFVFLTDYTDNNTENPTNAPAGTRHYIYSYNEVTKAYLKLVSGEFLNFSTTNRIIGINLLENLLFWTDDRNQPRKININLAIGSGFGAEIGGPYYTEEHQISVAKYNPYKPIDLYNRVDLSIINATVNSFEVIGDRISELLPYVGATIVSLENNVQGLNYIKIESVGPTFGSSNTRIVVTPDFPGGAPISGSFVSAIKSTMSNKTDDDQWPGDPDFLEDKFVRFSYRFKFDDNEYSLMAPFTQIAYIPKQNGFFVYGDEDAAYRSTIVDFMENKVQNIGLIIPLPDKASRLRSNYKISELEILFRESDGIAVRVLESISVSKISGENPNDNYYNYDYQSRKAYRTLPEAQTVRVYDRVPVRAFSQETSGNRIIYGNYRDQHTPPTSINYNCRIANKSGTGAYNNWIEYPNHSVKRNRNYQIGFVLADKFGRQSPVILSSVDLGTTNNGEFYSGSTIYSPYDLLPSDTNVETWFGDAIQVLVNAPITSTTNLSTGTPGLYAIPQQASSSGEGFAITTGFLGFQDPITDTTYTFILDDDQATGYPGNINVPMIGDSMRGAYRDFVKVTDVTNAGATYTITTDGRVSDIYLRTDNLPPDTPDLKFAYTINDLGWYSYKIVVKQTEQDYYNVYLPGILNGYPGLSGLIIDSAPASSIPGGVDNGLFPTEETNLTAHTVLFNDNINKIPRDLAEVGPDQKQYRSSVTLYGRVTNTMGAASDSQSNIQYYPRLDYKGINALSHTSTAIATAKDFNMGFSDLSTDTSVTVTVEGGGGTFTSDEPLNGNKVFYQIDTNPLIARISTTEKSIGAVANTPPLTLGVPAMLPFLAVYETAPFESNLNIYWETTSAGLIVDLNSDVATDFQGIIGTEDLDWDFDESYQQDQNVTSWFGLINSVGQAYLGDADVYIDSITDGNGEAQDGLFEVIAGADPGPNAGKFQIIFKGSGIVFNENSNVANVYTIVLDVTTEDDFNTQLTIGGEEGGEGALANILPTFNTIAPITIDQTDSIVLSAETWENASPVNGTYLSNGTSEKQGLVYRLSGSGYPSNWAMNPVNGEITQATPENPSSATERNFQGNPSGVYSVVLELIDANAMSPISGTSPSFSAIKTTQNLDIKITYAPVDAGTISNSCVITPNVSSPPAVIKAGEVADQEEEYRLVLTRYYYISEEEYTDPQYFQNRGVSGYGPQGDSEEFDTFRIGTAAHKKGAVVFSLNDFTSVGNILPSEAYWYYREVPDPTDLENPDPDFLPLEPTLEYNRTGGTGNSQLGPLDSYERELPEVDNGGITIPAGTNPNQDYWRQSLRAFDYQAFANIGVTRGVEYVVKVRGQFAFGGSPNNPPPNSCYTWLHVDDLHYPSCIPWQGTNLMDLLPAGKDLFRYNRSAASNSSNQKQSIPASPVEDDIYAETPYGEYVNEFYTTDLGNIVYQAADDTFPYINFKLDFNYLTTTPEPWTAMPTNSAQANIVDVTWVAGFSAFNNGQKYFVPGSVGVGARQTTSGVNVDDTIIKGTFKIRKR